MLEKLIAVSESRNQKINKIEKLKPLKSVQEAIQDLKKYAFSGYDSISDEDKTLFFKYFGIFDKEKSNGKNHFMLRVRIPGGQLTPTQAKKIGDLAYRYGNDYIDITTRMQFELRYLKIENLATVIEELESVGITTYQTGIDNLRNIVTDPLDAIAHDNVIECMPILEKLQEVFLKNDEWIGTLPRKFNTSISGNYANRCNVFGHDCCFALAQKNGIYGFNVYLGGRVGILAKSTNIFLATEDEIVTFFSTLIKIFKKYGFRDNRNKNRLHFFIEAIGMQTLISAIKEDCNIKFESEGTLLVSLEHFDAQQGKIALKNGTNAIHMVVPAGIFDGFNMVEVGKIAEEYKGDIRVSIDQNLYITGIKSSDVDKVLNHPVFTKYQNINSPFYNHMISCAGSDTCQFGVIAGKADALALSEYLTQKIPLKNAKIRIYWSACVKGCGIHELGDIGLLGCKTKVDGKTTLGVDILIGGNLLNGSMDAKLLLKSIPLEYAKYYIEELILIYKELKKPNESFEQFYLRVLSQYSIQAIAFIISFNYFTSHKNGYDKARISLSEKAKTFKHEAFEIFHFGERIYKNIYSKAPYQLVENFTPIGKSIKVDKSIPDSLSFIINKMIDANSTRAKVFSELLVEINKF